MLESDSEDDRDGRLESTTSTIARYSDEPASLLAEDFPTMRYNYL